MFVRVLCQGSCGMYVFACCCRLGELTLLSMFCLQTVCLVHSPVVIDFEPCFKLKADRDKRLDRQCLCGCACGGSVAFADLVME